MCSNINLYFFFQKAETYSWYKLRLVEQVSVSGVAILYSLWSSLTWCFSVAVICPSAGSGDHPNNGSMIFYANDTGLEQFEKWWNKSKTVPFYLIGLLLPLLNFKSPSFFSKFNILGKLRHCVMELLCNRVHTGFCGSMIWLGRVTYQAYSPMFNLFTYMLPCFVGFFWSLTQRKM